MNVIRNPMALDNAMSREYGEFWFLQESFKRTYSKSQLVEKIIVPKILSSFKQISEQTHYKSNNNAKLGLLGELLVKYIIGGTLSDDLYDSEKDLILEDGSTAEVKVATYFQKTGEFFIKDNASQTTIQKLTSVDHVYFIERKKKTIVLHKNTKSDYRFYRNWNCLFAPAAHFEEVAVFEDALLHSLFLELSDHRFDQNYMRN